MAQALDWVSRALIPTPQGLLGLSPSWVTLHPREPRLHEIRFARPPHRELQAVPLSSSLEMFHDEVGTNSAVTDNSVSEKKEKGGEKDKS